MKIIKEIMITTHPSNMSRELVNDMKQYHMTKPGISFRLVFCIPEEELTMILLKYGEIITEIQYD